MKIKVELAITPEARAQGLSGRPSLSENEGVLFVFDKPDKYSFWMKNMNFPLDITMELKRLKMERKENLKRKQAIHAIQ